MPSAEELYREQADGGPNITPQTSEDATALTVQQLVSAHNALHETMQSVIGAHNINYAETIALGKRVARLEKHLSARGLPLPCDDPDDCSDDCECEKSPGDPIASV